MEALCTSGTVKLCGGGGSLSVFAFPQHRLSTRALPGFSKKGSCPVLRASATKTEVAVIRIGTRGRCFFFHFSVIFPLLLELYAVYEAWISAYFLFNNVVSFLLFGALDCALPVILSCFDYVTKLQLLILFRFRHLSLDSNLASVVYPQEWDSV